MSWYSPVKQAAVDPDNPTADEQFPFSEHNAMVAYLKDKIINKTVNATAIGDNKILVYDLATDTFVFETPSAAGTLNDLTDVTISGVPADNEVLAYNTGTSKFINQTAAEAGLATVTGLASYLELAGGTMAGTLNMGDYQINGLDDMQAHDASGILFRDNGGTVSLRVSSTANSFIAYDECSMNSNKITDVTDPTAAQDASTKNYDDTHLFTKEVVTDFTDGYIPVYKTSSGKFEMEEGGGSAGLPVADTTNIVKGSADGTKLLRFEVDGITTGTTRVMTIPDKDILLEDSAACMLLSGTQAMAADLDMDSNWIKNCYGVCATGNNDQTDIKGGEDYGGVMACYGKSNPTALFRGDIRFFVPNAAGTVHLPPMAINGLTDTPTVDIYYGLDMNTKDIDDVGALILNDATELTIASGTVTVTQSYHSIDTEADAATDDVSTINGGTAGQVITIRAEDSERTVVVKDGLSNLQLEGDMSLDNSQDTISMIYDGTNWLETGRSNNGA